MTGEILDVTVDDQAVFAESRFVPSRGSPAVACGRRHRVMAVLLLAGLAVRLAVIYAYWPAFWFQGDSGTFIRHSASPRPGDSANPSGYPIFLSLFRPTGSLATVAIVQHLLGLLLAVGIYALLRRRGLPGWLAALGCVPILFDARQIVLEHYILSDSLFTVLVVAVVIALLWWERPPVAVFAIAGVLVFASMLTRTAGIASAAIILAYVVLRRFGWMRAAAFAGVAGVLLGGYLLWAKDVTGQARLSGPSARYIYSRVAGIADCSTLKLTAAQRVLCPPQPLGHRPMRGDYYLWNDPALRRMPASDNPLIASFATAVITQQTGDYAALVSRDTARYLVPGMRIDAGTRCLFGWWRFPATVASDVPNSTRCMPLLADSTTFSPEPVPEVKNAHAGTRAFLAGYSRWIVVPPVAQGIVVLAAIAAVAWRGRRAGWRDGRDAAFVVATGVGLLVLAVATSMYDVRYGVTATMLFGMGGAIAVHRLRTTTRRWPQVAAQAVATPGLATPGISSEPSGES